MSDIDRSLEALADAYVARGKAQARVKAKYAKYEQELAAAKQEDVGTVAQALVDAWNAGATVAATGRAMGTSNIYAARRVYYDAARGIQGEASAESTEFLDRLFLKARGEDTTALESVKRGLEQSAAGEVVDLGDFPSEQDTRKWVASWDVNGPDENGVYSVTEPTGRVATITRGIILGIPGANLAEFKDDAELHEIVSEVHGIPTKDFG